MGDYHDLYLQSNVLSLADVFESFRKLLKDTYDLDPCHYYSAPNISWDAMLKTTGISLELLSDIDMLLFCEKAIRGGLNVIGEKRFMKANNKYVPDYDRTRPSTYGLFLDVVNLYGGILTKHMPTGDFKWVNRSLSELLDEPNNSDKGYFVMVDLQKPLDLHDDHNDFPLGAEKLIIREKGLSNYQKSISRQETKTETLMETLFDKKRLCMSLISLEVLCPARFESNENQ